MKFALKKEFLFFSRTARLFWVIFAVLIFALVDPLLYKLLFFILGQAADAMGTDVPSLEPAVGLIGAEEVTAMSIGDITGTAALIVSLVLMSVCGGEQKKRSVIIPQCAGLTSPMYALPKFILYPLSVFAAGFISVPLCAVFSLLLFGGTFSPGVFLAGLAAGLYLAFLVTFELMLGICTARPGVAAVVTILSANFIPSILSLIQVKGDHINHYNPFALPIIASNAIVGENNALDAGVSVGTAIVLGLVLVFVTLFVLAAKKVENEGDKPAL